MQANDHAPRPAYWASMPAAVLDSPTLGDKAKLIYVEISRLLGPEGYCWVQDKYLAEKVRCSTRTVSRAIHDLAAAGLIRVEMSANHNGTERHIYAGLSPAAGGIDTHGETPQGGIDTSGETPQGGIDTSGETPQPIQYKVNNINNISTSTRARARGREQPVIAKEAEDVFISWAGDDSELLQRLRDMAHSRAALKRPYESAKAAKALVNKLDRLSGGDRLVMLSMLDEAVEYGWLSVFLPKGGAPAAASGPVVEAPDVSLWQPDDGGERDG